MPRSAPEKELPRLNRARVVAAAIALADAEGIEGLTMRRLSRHLGVVPMALYTHVANKDDLLDLMTDALFAEIDFDASSGWREALRARALSMRAVLLEHPWVIGRTESGRQGPERLQHHEVLMSCLREDAGLSFPMAVHAFSLMDSFIYGFALQQNLAPGAGEHGPSASMLRPGGPIDVDQLPYVHEFIATLGESGYDWGEEFRYILEQVLDVIHRLAS
jgi:AcrR family transcriptional regulator